MASNVGVLEIGQDEGTQPKTYVSKCVAALMCRRLEAEQVSKRLIRRVVIKSAELVQGVRHAAQKAKTYIPESMPPVIDKMLGVRFEDPIKSPVMPRFRRLSGFDRARQFEL